MGVPARCAVDFKGVEYFDGADWQFWQMQAAVPASGALHVTSGKDLRPLQDFGVAGIDEGFLRTLDDLPWEKTRDGLACAMQPGDYILLEPRREDSGVTVPADSLQRHGQRNDGRSNRGNVTGMKRIKSPAIARPRALLYITTY